MFHLPTPEDVERLAQEAGKSMAQVCREAEIAPSTFTRWKAGKNRPTLDVCERLLRAVQPS